jgi:hypothetical protein
MSVLPVKAYTLVSEAVPRKLIAWLSCSQAQYPPPLPVLEGASKCIGPILGLQSTDIVNHSHRYKDFQGSLYYNGSTVGGLQVYGAAYMVQSSPSMICPYFNDTAAYRSGTGLGYYIACGALYYTGTDISTTRTTSKSPELLGCCNLDIFRSLLISARHCVVHNRMVILNVPWIQGVPLLTLLSQRKQR